MSSGAENVDRVPPCHADYMARLAEGVDLLTRAVAILDEVREHGAAARASGALDLAKDKLDSLQNGANTSAA
jgi:hypothetical protein